MQNIKRYKYFPYNIQMLFQIRYIQLTMWSYVSVIFRFSARLNTINTDAKIWWAASCTG